MSAEKGFLYYSSGMIAVHPFTVLFVCGKVYSY